MLTDYLTILYHYLLPKHALTRLAGYLSGIKHPRIKNYLIRYFIRKYDVDLQEAREENPEAYVDFNAFFIRQLKPECRLIADATIVSPVDGFISEIGNIHAGRLLQAKGRYYSMDELLGGVSHWSSPFKDGLFATLYLSPKDYHRVHMPIEATLQHMIYLPGQLFSVQPASARVIPNLFSGNERLVVFFDTAVGPMAMVLVGATIVGAIGTCWHGDLARSHEPRIIAPPVGIDGPIHMQKADEMGYFKLGSTVIVLFSNREQLQWQAGLQAGDGIRFGQALGQVKGQQSIKNDGL
jgi:phosphatidylserine decarboxylase